MKRQLRRVFVVGATVTPPPVTPGYVPLAMVPGAGAWTVP